MAILYTQILEVESQRILTGEFSPQSNNLKPTNDDLKELRNFFTASVSNAPGNINAIDSADKRFRLYVKISQGLAYALITDRYTSNKLASKYIDELSALFIKSYTKDSKKTFYEFDPIIKSTSGQFNKNSGYEQGMVAVEETKGILADSLNLIIKRDENLNNLKGLASKMSMEAQMMHKKVQKLHLESMTQQYGLYAGIVVVLLIILYYIFH